MPHPDLRFVVPAGMLCIILLLWALDAASPKLAQGTMGAFTPALDWIARWLPLFYVPVLVQLPITLSGFTGQPASFKTAAAAAA